MLDLTSQQVVRELFQSEQIDQVYLAAAKVGGIHANNEPYAIAKIAGIKLCESYNRQYWVDYRSVMPTNLYGENDNFHPENKTGKPGPENRGRKPGPGLSFCKINPFRETGVRSFMLR